MPLERFERYSVITYIAAPVYQLCNGFCKLSLLTIYLQLSPQKWFRVTTWISIVIVILYTTIITAIMFFHCSPIRKAFDFKLAEGSCMDAGVLYMATAVSNIITDVILFILPTPMVWRLEMSKAQRIGAIVIFGIGSMTIATSIVRLVYLPATLKSTDPSWDAAAADVWTFVEGNLFVICGSMPTIRRFTRHLFPSVFATPAASPSTSHKVNTMSDSKRSNRKERKQYELFTEDNEMDTLRTMEEEHVLQKDGDCDGYSENTFWDSRKTTPRHD
ncbi:hypothetical protein VHEMI09991 [[Torrubiella] hemipterigena]|nr:hypothetical protein VHEMI09991 [[Torrubiella] hemipterigena]